MPRINRLTGSSLFDPTAGPHDHGHGTELPPKTPGFSPAGPAALAPTLTSSRSEGWFSEAELTWSLSEAASLSLRKLGDTYCLNCRSLASPPQPQSEENAVISWQDYMTRR